MATSSGADLGRRRATDGPGPPTGSWRVWLVTDVYPPDCGGSGWSTHALARALVDNGHLVEVISLDPKSGGLAQRSYDGIRVSEVGVRSARRNPGRRVGSRDYTYRTLATYLAHRLVREPEVDILHAQHLHSGPPTLHAARSHGRGAILTLRDYWPVCLHGTSWWGGDICAGCSSENLAACMKEYWGWPRPLARVMVPWARGRLGARRDGVTAAHRVLAVSESVRQRVEAELPAVSLSVVPNVVDPRAVEAAAAAAAHIPDDFGSPYLVTAGKLVPTKGFDLLLTALDQVRCRVPLVVAGDGPQRRELEERASALNLAVRFLGWVEHGSLLRLQQRAHAVVLPSAWNEPLSRLLLETMALGAPVIAWARGGSNDVIRTGENGWLVNRAADLAAALDALGSPEQRRRVGDAARETVWRRYSPGAVYPMVAEAYTAALERAGRAVF